MLMSMRRTTLQLLYLGVAMSGVVIGQKWQFPKNFGYLVSDFVGPQSQYAETRTHSSGYLSNTDPYPLKQQALTLGYSHKHRGKVVTFNNYGRKRYGSLQTNKDPYSKKRPETNLSPYKQHPTLSAQLSGPQPPAPNSYQQQQFGHNFYQKPTVDPYKASHQKKTYTKKTEHRYSTKRPNIVYHHTKKSFGYIDVTTTALPAYSHLRTTRQQFYPTQSQPKYRATLLEKSTNHRIQQQHQQYNAHVISTTPASQTNYNYNQFSTINPTFQQSRHHQSNNYQSSLLSNRLSFSANNRLVEEKRNGFNPVPRKSLKSLDEGLNDHLKNYEVTTVVDVYTTTPSYNQQRSPFYTFYYFPLRFHGEAIRFIFHYKGIDFVDKVVSEYEWSSLKQSVPFALLPALELDGRRLAKTTAIARYLGKEFGLIANDNWLDARADMLADCAQDMVLLLSNYSRLKLDGAPEILLESELNLLRDELSAVFLARFEAMLVESREAGNQWFVFNKPHWVDFVIGEWMGRLEELAEPYLLDSYPQLRQHAHRLANLPGVRQYIVDRQNNVVW